MWSTDTRPVRISSNAMRQSSGRVPKDDCIRTSRAIQLGGSTGVGSQAIASITN